MQDVHMWELLDRAMVSPPMRLIFGALWILAGIGWHLRSTRNEAAPSTPLTLLSQPQAKTGEQRGWETGTGIALIALGLFYVVTGWFSQRW